MKKPAGGPGPLEALGKASETLKEFCTTSAPGKAASKGSYGYGESSGGGSWEG